MSTLQACSSGFPESRYYVIKEADLYEAGRVGLIPLHFFETLVSIKSALDAVRAQNHKSPLETLIIEKDWPEYQPAFNLLAARVMSELNAIEGGVPCSS